MLRVFSLLIVVGLTAVPRPSNSVCSLIPFPFFSGPNFTYFVATGDSDSVGVAAPTTLPLVGRFAGPPGTDSTTAVPELLHGQVVQLERIGGAHAPVVRGLIESGFAGAIVVPYGYRSDCRPIAWESSAIWIDTTNAGLFWAQLRPEEEWVEGKPVFDATVAYHLPYPTGWFPMYSRPRVGPDLTIDELWSLLEVLPDRDLFAANTDAALAPLDAWKDRNRDLVGRFPAVEIIRGVDFYTRRERGD